jgi:hypothetical protein
MVAAMPLVDVLNRINSAFVERVTKQFYQRFKVEHDVFLAFVQDFQNISEREWYTSLMLNRLMFLYFIQKHRFLDNDPHYLRTRLQRMPDVRGDNQFITFYRYFLRRLFHEGLAQPTSVREPDLEALLGDVPYFNSGLFDRHTLEEQNDAIEIADDAFERIFDFFDSFDWILDDRPMSDDREINADVLGYVFEQYINKKEMGAYYTQEDITGYIATNTIIPHLFDVVEQHCRYAFTADGPIWSLLPTHPDCYIHADMRHGVDLPLPRQIEAGRNDTSRRTDWNAPADPAFGLPKETWREHIARRTGVEELRARLRAGQIVSINDCVTYNLDLTRLLSDIIVQTNDTTLLRVIYTALIQISVLDPTCGSGAFLLAALKVLEPLYEACLMRMETFTSCDQEADTFQDILEQFSSEGSRTYSIRTSIVINNLYGVDIMPEAIEICKLRLFLKMLAPVEQLDIVGRLPDITFNIRAGNALIGYVGEAFSGVTDPGRLAAKLNALGQNAQIFRALQLTSNADPGISIQQRRQLLEEHSFIYHQLNCSLARSLGEENGDSCAQWAALHKPYHWIADFGDIMQRGGFDVIIGNPPYVTQNRAERAYAAGVYRTEPCGNLYALVVERSLALLRAGGRLGMIVPIASVSTEGMRELQALYDQQFQWHSHFAVRPGKLFDGVDMNLTISLLHNTGAKGRGFTTGYRRWSNGKGSDRPYLFTTLSYTTNPYLTQHSNPFPKLGSTVEADILRKMLAHGRRLRDYLDAGGETIYYHSGGRYWRKALEEKLSSHYKPLTVRTSVAPVVFGLLNSQLFYWYWISNSNCMDVVAREVLDLPVFALEQAPLDRFAQLRAQLLEAYYGGVVTRRRQGRLIDVEERNFDVAQAKPIIDKLDMLLAKYYGFTDKERDVILNYDIKYRVRR